MYNSFMMIHTKTTTRMYEQVMAFLFKSLSKSVFNLYARAQDVTSSIIRKRGLLQI